MQRSVNNLVGYSIVGTDGEMGRVEEFFFDDFSWSIRYLVVNTGNWLSERKVLIPHAALGKTDWESRIFNVNLTVEQVKNSPAFDTEKTVSRQNESELFEHYMLPVYWGEDFYATPFGMVPSIHINTDSIIKGSKNAAHQIPEDPHLRSTSKVKGYHIHATDGEIGHIEDFLVDDKNWNLCSLVVDTKNWLPGKKVIIKTGFINRIVWDESEVYVNLTQESIKKEYEFDPSITELK